MPEYDRKTAAKRQASYPPSIAIPQLNENSPNNFLTWLFAQVNENIRDEAARVERAKAEYTAVMNLKYDRESGDYVAKSEPITDNAQSA